MNAFLAERLRDLLVWPNHRRLSGCELENGCTDFKRVPAIELVLVAGQGNFGTFWMLQFAYLYTEISHTLHRPPCTRCQVLLSVVHGLNHRPLGPLRQGDRAYIVCSAYNHFSFRFLNFLLTPFVIVRLLRHQTSADHFRLS